MHEQLFGDLRSLLQRPPSDEVWAALCELLDLWPAEPLEALAIPYALEHLARWPAALRCDAPRSWIDALQAGQPCPQLSCARALTLIIPFSIFPTKHHQRMLDAPLLRSLRELTIVPELLDAAALGAWLHRAQHLDALNGLIIVCERLDDDHIDALVTSPSLSRLTSLGLRQGYAITHHGALALATSPHLSNLTALDLCYAKIGDEGVDALATFLQSMTSL